MRLSKTGKQKAGVIGFILAVIGTAFTYYQDFIAVKDIQNAICEVENGQELSQTNVKD